MQWIKISWVIVMGFDPIERSSQVESSVMRGFERKYYRFRSSSHYGGIVTADTVGCNLLCAYCWNYFRNERPTHFGEFFSPEIVASELRKISRKTGYKLFRVSGAEPILGEISARHVAEIIKLTNGEFILETNGLMFGYKPELIDLFTGLKVHVRLNVKGWDEKSFEKITGASGEFFQYQLKAIEKLQGKVHFWIAIMYDVFREVGVKELKKKLSSPCEIEEETLNDYSFVIENMKKRGIQI